MCLVIPHMCACVWKAEAKGKYLLRALSTVFFETTSLLEPELTSFARLPSVLPLTVLRFQMHTVASDFYLSA